MERTDTAADIEQAGSCGAAKPNSRHSLEPSGLRLHEKPIIQACEIHRTLDRLLVGRRVLVKSCHVAIRCMTAPSIRVDHPSPAPIERARDSLLPAFPLANGPENTLKPRRRRDQKRPRSALRRSRFFESNGAIDDIERP